MYKRKRLQCTHPKFVSKNNIIIALLPSIRYTCVGGLGYNGKVICFIEEVWAGLDN